ncbi:hypothetical protein [Pantoea sp. At-9b]|uniref:hypothetical protein n=1 Tax=Pantoea sp. (strain At-9b) TaxID=592316 RepID=UPI0005A1F1D3|nr:hypothetical protein [Pantoea sp. At-9b]
MANTFICRNADGTVQFDMSNRLGKIRGITQIAAGAAGTINTGIDTSVSDVWFYVYASQSDVFSVPPSVSVSGATISYSGAGSAYSLIYGAY